ncbi:lipid II:glycine glycyltransferase FemX [Flexivirga alba]|uniref:Lipid II:glycine glycyltransferase FemX n=1 Tax=Flexivirga alba TaxID=702742 RepID=A0ABW2AKU0_9MICO
MGGPAVAAAQGRHRRGDRRRRTSRTDRLAGLSRAGGIPAQRQHRTHPAHPGRRPDPGRGRHPGAFNSSTRQNVRKSFRAEGVRFGEVTTDTDLQQVLAINKETGKRAGFAVHDDGYHLAIRDLMGERSQLIAAWDGDDVAAFVWLVVSGDTAFELYGGVSPRGMKLRLNYGLKFHAMKHVKAQGVSRYDFNGLLNDGISDFKRQFSKHEDLLIGTWDKPLSPLYPAFATALPTVRHALKRGLPAAKATLRDPKAALAGLRSRGSTSS